MSKSNDKVKNNKINFGQILLFLMERPTFNIFFFVSKGYIWHQYDQYKCKVNKHNLI